MVRDKDITTLDDLVEADRRIAELEKENAALKKRLNEVTELLQDHAASLAKDLKQQIADMQQAAMENKEFGQ
jgi:Tfp pilus assembly protein PilN